MAWLRRHLGALLTLLAGAVVVGRAWADPTRYYPGAAYLDGYGTTWYYWFMGEVLAGRQPLMRTDRLFFPWGKEVYLHTGGNLLDAALVQPLRLLLGPALAYNAWIVVLLATNAWGAARVAAALGVPAGARWPAMLTLTLAPYVLQEIDQGRPTQAMLVFPALSLAALIRLGSLKDAALAGVGMALAGLTYWYDAVVLAVLAAPLGTYRVLRGPERGATALRLGVAAALAVGLVLPAAAPMLEALGEGTVPGLLAMDGQGPLAPLSFRTEQGDAEGLFVLAASGMGGTLFDVPELGFRAALPLLLPTHLLIVGIAIGLGRTRGRGIAGSPGIPWLLGGLWIAAGPALAVGDWLLANTPYLWLMQASDVIRRWWWPGRAVFVPTLVIAGLAGVAWAAAPAGWRRVVPAAILVIGLVVPLARVELLPLGRWDGASSPALDCLAAAPEGGVIDLPLVAGQENLYYQTLHHQPLLGGMLMKKEAFGPPELHALKRENSFLALILTLGDRNFGARPEWDPADREALVGLGFRYVLVQLERYARMEADGRREKRVTDWPRVRRLLNLPLGNPQVEDERFAVYTLGGERLGCGGG